MDFLLVRAALLCNLLAADGFEFLNQLLQCHQTRKTGGGGKLQAIHGRDEPGVAGYLNQPMKPLKSSRRGRHPLHDILLPVGIRDRPGILTVTSPA